MIIFLRSLLVLFLALVVFCCFIFLLTPLFSRVPFIPVRKKILKNITEAFGGLSKKSLVYDLGCGDGRVLFEIAKEHRELSCVGVEKAPFPYYWAKIKNYFYGYKNVTIKRGDMFETEISKATHVFLYLFPELLDKLLPKFEKELSPGARVISCDFQFSKRKPNKIIDLKSKKGQLNKKLYLYDF